MTATKGLLAEYRLTGNNPPQLKAQYGWNPDGIWGTDPVWIKTTREGANTPEIFYFQNDHLGTPQKIKALPGLSFPPEHNLHCGHEKYSQKCVRQ